MNTLLAQYNSWMNARVYSVCEQLSDEDRKLDRGAFFNSIHGTLNHLIVGDKVWLARFQGTTFTVPSLDFELYANFNDLHKARLALDKEIETWAAALTAEVLSTSCEYTSVVDNKKRKYDMSVAVAHFFNHQTHHRGQITTLLSQCGLDCGLTDLIGLPAIEP